MAQKGQSDFLEVSHLDNTFFLEVLKRTEQAWPEFFSTDFLKAQFTKYLTHLA